MAFKFIADTFSVARDSDHFLQLKTLKKPETEDQVWLAIEIIGDSKYARSTAQSIIDTTEEVFFSNAELGAYERFEQSLKEVNIILKSLKEKRKKSFGEINALIAVFSGNQLYLTQCNSAEAYLVRHGKFSMISEGLANKSEDLFVNIASGELMADDKLLFSTTRLLRLATHSQMIQLFNDGVAEAIEALRELAMHDEELNLGVIALHLKLSQRPVGLPEALKGNKYINYLKEALGKISGFLGEKLGRQTSGVNKKKILIILAAVVLVLVLSVSFLMENRRQKAIRDEYRVKIEALHQEILTANTKGYAKDKEGANAILEKTEKDARAILETNYFRPEVLALLEKIQETRDTINNTDRLKKLAPYVDLTSKATDAKAIGLLNLDDNFFAYEYNRFFEIILDQVLEPRVLDNTEIVLGGTAMEDQDVLVFLTKSGRVMEYEKGQIRFATTEDQAWKTGVAVAAYGKNIYILNPQENQIYKYSRLRAKYSSGTPYSSDVNLSEALSLAIDGDVYILKTGGNIIRLYKSKQQQFKIEDLAVDISETTKIFTSPELDNLYLLDPKNKRVVIVTKTESGLSRYYGQMVFEDLDNIRDFYVEKSEKKLYVLTDKEIYRIDI